MIIYSWFTYYKWWFSIAMLVYERVCQTDSLLAFTVCYHYEVKIFVEKCNPSKPRFGQCSNLTHLVLSVMNEWPIFRCNTTAWCFGTFFFTSWECHNPNWRIHIFQRGWLKPPTRRRSVWLMFYSVKEVTEPPLKLGICWFWGTPKLNQREANTKRGRRFLIRSWDCCLISIPIGSMCAIYGNIYHQYTPNVSIYTRKHPDSPTPLYTWGYQTLDFTFNWEDQQGYLGNINFPPPLNFYIHWRSSIRV